jgi:hypothetical protein
VGTAAPSWQHLAHLFCSSRKYDGHCALVAELLVEHDRLPEAARWC